MRSPFNPESKPVRMIGVRPNTPPPFEKPSMETLAKWPLKPPHYRAPFELPKDFKVHDLGNFSDTTTYMECFGGVAKKYTEAEMMLEFLTFVLASEKETRSQTMSSFYRRQRARKLEAFAHKRVRRCMRALTRRFEALYGVVTAEMFARFVDGENDAPA